MNSAKNFRACRISALAAFPRLPHFRACRISALAALGLLFFATLPCEAARIYSKAPGIQAEEGSFTIYKENSIQTVTPGQTVAVWVNAAVDNDSWQDGNDTGVESDSIRYQWKGGTVATFENIGGRFATWKAPNRVGTYTIACVINDRDYPPFHKRDDVLVQLTTSVKVVSGASVWLESDMERSYQLGASNRRVKMPDGAIQVKTVHSAAQWSIERNRWVANRNFAVLRADGQNKVWGFTGTHTRTMYSQPESRRLVFELSSESSRATLVTSGSVVASAVDGSGAGRMNIVWHKPYENVWWAPRPTKVYTVYSASKSVEFPNGATSVGVSDTNVDVTVVRSQASEVLKTSKSVLEYVFLVAGTIGAGVVLKSPLAVGVADTLVAFTASEMSNIEIPDQTETTNNSYEMWQRSVNADRTRATTGAARGEPPFISPSSVLRRIRLTGTTNDVGWIGSRMHNIGLRHPYSTIRYTAREYDEHGYIGVTTGLRSRPTSGPAHMGFYNVSFQPIAQNIQ